MLTSHRMPSGLETALQKALSVRLNLQISLSQLPIIEEWMDIHLDRWLEHNPTPPEMPDGEEVSYLAMLGSDLRRVWWGAWGDPRGFVPKMADYFKLCNIAKSHVERIERFTQAIGDSPFSELEFAMPGDTVDAQVETLSAAFTDFTGAPLSPAIIERLRTAPAPAFGLSIRVRGGQIVRVGGLAPGLDLNAISALCADAKIGVDGKLPKLVG